MRILFTLILFFFLIFLLQTDSYSQCNQTPCTVPFPQVNAQDACILPSPDYLDCYYGQTTPDPPVSFPPYWCSAIHNNHWFAFVADAAVVSFDISCFGCSLGNGIQAAVLSTQDCVNFTFVSPCLGDIPSGTTQTLTATGLIPGQPYYLCIDGSGGALCDYAINGNVPNVNGTTTGICLPSSPTGSYTTSTVSTWSINPPGAGNFVGSSIGTQVQIIWQQPGPAQVCAQSLNCPNSPEYCLDVVVGEDTGPTEEHVDLCQGHTTTCAGQTFSSAGTFNVNLPSYLDCDSIIRCVVHLIPTVYSTETVNLCQGQSVTCAGQEFYSPGSFPVVLPAYQGCDSIVTCKVNLIPLYNSPTYVVTMCGPAEYKICDETYTSSGVYAKTCTSSLGCDSIVNVNLAILEPVAKIAPPAILDCDVNKIVTLNGTGSSVNNALGGLTLYKWTGPGIIGVNNQPTVQINQPGVYCLILTHARGGVYCYDTTCVTVTATSAVPQLPLVSGNPNPCADSTVIYTATAVGTPPPTSFNWVTPNGIPFTVLSQNSIQITWSGATTGGPLCVTANNSCGASAPACIPIAVQPALLPPVMAGPGSVCAGGGPYIFTLDSLQPSTTYSWTTPPGAVLTDLGDTVIINFLNAASGNVCVTAQNACGTGAPVCQNVQVSPVPTIDLIGGGQICNGETLNLTFNLSGNGPFDVTWTDGVQNLTLNNIASGHTVPVNPTQTTKYRLLNFNDNSTPTCTAPVADSVTVTVWQHASLSQTAQICEGESILLGGALRTTSGVYVDSLNTIHGCDSIVTTALTVYEIDSLVLSSTTCDPTLAGTTTQFLTQTNGCDSIVTSTVTLLPSDSTLIFDTNCDPANVGVFTQNLSNIYGCDSTVVTTITFSLSDTTSLSATTCDPAAAGVFTQNFTTVDGCDSLVITTVTLLPSSTTLVSGVSCNPANVGVFTKNLSNQYGCDSTVVTTITFFHLDTTFLAAANCDPAATGIFTQTLVTPDGCDSVIITNVSLLPSNTTTLSGTSCNPAEVGVFTQNLSNQYGCDSTVVTTISFFHLDTTFLAAANCDPAATGVFAQTLVTPDGCDSVIVTTVSLLPSSQTAIQSSTCDPSAAGVFTYHLFNQWGCDSTVTETVALLPSDTTYLAFNTCDPTQVGTITNILSNQWGCDSTIIAVTSLLPPASCGVAVSLTGSNIPCGANTGTLTITATLGEAPFNYTILLGATPVNTGTLNAVGVPQTVSGLVAGNYTLNVSSANGFGTTAQASIVQLVPPTVSASVVSSYSGYAISCTGEADGSARALASGGLPPYTFAWSNGGATQQIDNVTAGNYTVTVTDANACTNTATVVLNEPTPLLFSFTVNNLDCFGHDDGAIFVEANGGAKPYKYALDNGNFQTSNVFLGLDAGSYKVTVLDANDCQRTEVIAINALIPLVVELGDNQTIQLGENTVLEALVNYPLDSILSVAWTPSFDTSECPECLTQTIAPLVSTTYSVQVTALNGCKDDDKVVVIVDRRKHLFVPNVFSPNDDGESDLFSIFAKPGTVNIIKSLQIFDRWGEALYELYDFMPNDPTIGWEGDFRGQKMSPGVYVWYLEVEFIDGEVEIYKGDVTLVR